MIVYRAPFGLQRSSACRRAPRPRAAAQTGSGLFTRLGHRHGHPTGRTMGRREAAMTEASLEFVGTATTCCGWAPSPCSPTRTSCTGVSAPTSARACSASGSPSPRCSPSISPPWTPSCCPTCTAITSTGWPGPAGPRAPGAHHARAARTLASWGFAAPGRWPPGMTGSRRQGRRCRSPRCRASTRPDRCAAAAAGDGQRPGARRRRRPPVPALHQRRHAVPSVAAGGRGAAPGRSTPRWSTSVAPARSASW